jgi:hypothetical protein
VHDDCDAPVCAAIISELCMADISKNIVDWPIGAKGAQTQKNCFELVCRDMWPQAATSL